MIEVVFRARVWSGYEQITHGHVYQFLSCIRVHGPTVSTSVDSDHWRSRTECKMTMNMAMMLTVAAGLRVRRGGVAELTTHVLVKMLVSTVNLTMLTRALLLKRPSLLLSLTSCTVQ